MAKPDIILIGGRADGRRDTCRLRRQQLEKWNAPQATAAYLFELKDDRRPATERSAPGRYAEPTIFEDMPGADKARDDCKFTFLSPRGASSTTLAMPAV
jgi:hypothetical protein